MSARGDNLLLSELEPGVWAKLQERSRWIDLSRADVVQHPATDLDFVYFPDTAVLAVTAETSEGESVDVVLVGSEGVFGAFEACGSRQSYSRVGVHVAGRVLKTPASVYRELFDASPALRNVVHRYVELLLIEARQFVACNALHSVDNRLSRALLDTFDRTGSRTLMLTQDALAQMLGVQRTTVAAAISGLQRAGFIKTGRGSIELLDLEDLELAACNCRETLAIAREGIINARTRACEA